MKRFISLFIFLSASSAFATLPACNTIVGQKMCDQIGQMLIVGFGGYDQDNKGNIIYNDSNGTVFKKNALVAKYIRDDHVGGVILFSKYNYNNIKGNYFRPRNIKNPQQLTALNENLQTYNTQTREKQNLLSLPLIISVDQEGGHADRLSRDLGFKGAALAEQSFGTKLALAGINKKQKILREAYTYAFGIGQELKAMHFNVNFSPVVDVNINPTNPIIGGLGRSFSSNPEIVTKLSWQYIKAYEANDIMPVIKHFPGHGSSSSDSHLGLVDVTNSYQMQQELYPYKKLINENFGGMIMTTHVINGQIDKTQCRKGKISDHQTWCPGTMSYKTLTDLLRNKLHYHGIIISDDMTMKAITNEYSLSEALANGINAGVDMFIISNNKKDETQHALDTIAQLVKNKKVSAKKINQAYTRIVTMKKHLTSIMSY